MTVTDVMKRLAKFVGKPCALEVPEDLKTWGRGPEAWPAIVLDWSEVDQDDRETFIIDSLADTFPNAHELVPFVLLGPSGLHDNGATLADAGQFDGVLFLDLAQASDSQCPVLAWNTDEPAQQLRRVADDVGELALELVDPAA